MKMNKDVETRDIKLFGEYDPNKYMGGIRNFDQIDVSTLKWLVENNYANPDEQQNLAPSIQEFIDFMETHEGYFAGGYAVSEKRDDYRVSIDNISRNTDIPTKDEIAAFVNFASSADELDAKGFAWWD